MADLPARPKKPAARRVRRKADEEAAKQRLRERKAAEYRRSRDLRAARGKVALWRWVPKAHAGLIRDVVVAFCRALQADETSLPLLSWEQREAPTSRAPGTSEPGPSPAATDGATPAGDGTSAEADDTAAWRGTGLQARRRVQARRARARKRAAGLTRLRLVVPQALKPEVSGLLEELRAGLDEGLLPVLSVAASAGTILNSKHATKNTEDPAPTRTSIPSPAGGAATATPATPGGVSESRPGVIQHPREPRSASARPDPLRPGAENSEAGRRGTRLLPGPVGVDSVPISDPPQTSPLFDDIHALDCWPGLFAAGSADGRG